LCGEVNDLIGGHSAGVLAANCVVNNSGRRLWRGQCPSIPEQISGLVHRHAGDDARIARRLRSKRIDGPGSNC
jgi:hypothetical protein